MKLLTVAIPCYNSESYMEHCINTLLTGGEEVEIIIVDDGSAKDRTGEIADRYAREYPTICRAIHQENGGHGEAVNTGLKNATGIFFKVVDSDDWVNEEAYVQVLDTLRRFVYGLDLSFGVYEFLYLPLLFLNFLHIQFHLKPGNGAVFHRWPFDAAAGAAVHLDKAAVNLAPHHALT